MIELHGNASYAACLDCGLRHELDVLKQSFLGKGQIPACRDCGGIVKTATVSFGQSMPAQPMMRARDEALACDLFLVLGSSLVVQPAASFPELAAMNGAKLVIVNRDPTPLDEIATWSSTRTSARSSPRRCRRTSAVRCRRRTGVGTRSRTSPRVTRRAPRANVSAGNSIV